MELELDRPQELRAPGGLGPVVPSGRVSALVRLHGHPLGLVQADGAPGDPAGLRRALVAAAHRELPLPEQRHHLDLAAPLPWPDPTVSVVVATHNRPQSLRRCLDSLLRTRYPGLEVLVVDNAPATDEARRLVLTGYPPQVRYLREPVPGLARAHNRGLVAAHGAVVAFTDDDTMVDPRWPSALAEAFATDRSVGCVTGLILPAELETPAQAALEAHGGYAKGFALRRWSMRERPPGEPLFPFAGGRFGSGANMAFRASLLRRLGGFDPATGTGTPARGGDDLLAFFRVLTSGASLVYQPDAIVWHHHHRTPDAVPAQAFGYGVGFGAYLTAAVRHQPGALPALLKVLPRGVGMALRGAGRDAAQGPPLAGASPAELARLQLRGLAYGPIGYLRSALQDRYGAGRAHGGSRSEARDRSGAAARCRGHLTRTKAVRPGGRSPWH
ncbi:glycosyltransferase family 2 protein [Streptacidiphilus anmyonensis]|uniref:glycosyltransferase family 2 protein n=1 Tax=Streptacidiphilus anmyonensis TaxID=405782 RepID=UPI0007C708C5|nr:glycosyltransferase family 2 protein [Streptacidiphilus anmyonensis]